MGEKEVNIDGNQAGAIDLPGKEYGLTNAISTNLSYYFWGTDPERRGP